MSRATARLPQGVHLGLYVLMTVFALLALRVVLQAALLREEHEPGSGAPLLCPNCGQLVPDMAFCSNCGVAAYRYCVMVANHEEIHTPKCFLQDPFR